MNEELLQEAPLLAPAVRPQGVVNSPSVSVPPVKTSQFTVPSASQLPQFSAGPAMDETRQSDWAKLSALRKSYLGAPPPANWVPEGFHVSSAVQVSQATIPQFFNFVGSSSGMSLPTEQTSTSMEQNTLNLDLPQTVGFSPEFLETYSQQMKKVSGLKSPQPTVREPKSSIQDEDEYSGTEISSREAAWIKRDVQGVMK